MYYRGGSSLAQAFPADVVTYLISFYETSPNWEIAPTY